MRLKILLLLLSVTAAVIVSLPAYADTEDWANVYEYALYPTFSLSFAGGEGIIADRSGNIWLGAQDTRAVYGSPRAALVKIDPRANRLYYWYLTGLQQVGALAYNRATNDIWIADAVGAKLCKFNTTTRRYTVYDLSDFMTNGSMNDCCSIALDRDGILYLALFDDDEIAIFDPSELEITNIPVPEETEDDSPYGIAVSSDGADIWYTAYTANNAFVHVDLSEPGTATFTEFALGGSVPGDPRCILLDEGPSPAQVYFVEAHHVGNVGCYIVGMDSPLDEFQLAVRNSYGIGISEASGTLWVSEPGDNVGPCVGDNCMARLSTPTAEPLAFTTTSGDSDAPDPADVDAPAVSILKTRGPYSIRPQWLAVESEEYATEDTWATLTADQSLGAVAVRKVTGNTEGWGLGYDTERVIRVVPAID